MVGQKEVCFLVTASATYVYSLAFLKLRLKNFTFVYMYNYEFLCVYAVCVCHLPRRPEEGIGFCWIPWSCGFRQV